MDKGSRQTVKAWLRGTLFSNPFGFTLNIKKRCNGIWIDLIAAQNNVRYFINRLNNNLLKHKYSRGGARLKGIAAFERGSFRERLHWHSIIDVPEEFTPKDVKQIAASCWSKTDLSYGKPHIVKPTDDGWLSYITKLNSCDDEIDFDNLYLGGSDEPRT